MVRIHSLLLAIVMTLCLATTPSNAAAQVKTLEISRENAKLLEQIGSYSDLETLSIVCLENLKSLPDAIGNLTRLKELRIDNGNGCSMNPVLPEAIGNLHSLERLILYGAQDPRLPGHRSGERHEFPHAMSRLKNIVYLDLGRNGFEEIPAFVHDLPKLRELGFQWNIHFRKIPAFLSNLQELTTLKLDGNDLDDLPDSLGSLPKLTRTTLGNNCLITQNEEKMRDLKTRFPKVTFDFADEYDCPSK